MLVLFSAKERLLFVKFDFVTFLCFVPRAVSAPLELRLYILKRVFVIGICQRDGTVYVFLARDVLDFYGAARIVKKVNG